MKKTFFIMVFAAIAGNASAQTSLGVIPNPSSLQAIPEAFSYDGQPTLYIKSENAHNVTILDDDFKNVKTITSTGGKFFTFYLYDWRTTYCDDQAFVLSQTLFNKDAAIEYVEPIVSGNDVIGFSVVSESGGVLKNVLFDPGFRPAWMEMVIYLIADKCFMLVGNFTDTQVYRIDRTSPSRIDKVRTISGLSISPRIADRSETITVECDGTASELQVINAAGQIVERIPLTLGQKEVTFSARGLSRGVNVVKLVGGKDSDNCKIIVK